MQAHEEQLIQQQQERANNAYYKQKPEGDLDLVNEVRALLVANNSTSDLVQSYDNNNYIRDAAGKESSVQRFLLNRYWTYQLLLSNVPSIEERHSLIPNGDTRDWLRIFEKSILPFALKNNLPKAILI